MTTLTTTPSASLTIELDEDTLRQHANGTITGIIMWRINGESFPDDRWNDFVVVVLSWWTSAIIRLLTGNSTAETLDLMDGPFSLICECSGESVSCRFVNRRGGDLTVAVWSGKTPDLAKQILTAGKNTLRKCHQNSWMNPDIKLLENEVNVLRKMI